MDGVPVRAKQHYVLVWMVGFARWGEDSPATKGTDAEILQNPVNTQTNISTSKFHLVSCH